MEPINLTGIVTALAEKPHAKAYLSEQRAIGATPLEGEAPKTSEDRQIVQISGRFISDELRNLGVMGRTLSENQVHFVSLDTRNKFMSDVPSCASYEPISHAAYIVTTDHTRVDNIVRTTEEMLHGATQQSYRFYPKEKRIDPLKSGYRNRARAGKDLTPFFIGLDEGVINIMKADIIRKHLPELAQALSLLPEEHAQLSEPSEHSDYPLFRDVTQIIMRNIADQRHIPYEKIYDEFKRGLFQEQPRAPIMIEQSYGKQGVEILAYLGIVNPEHDQRIKTYFSTGNQQERERLGQTILTDTPQEVRQSYQTLGKDQLFVVRG